MSAARAAKATRVPPSTFAALLRRSKFSSYDPTIGQIYASYDGSAARGDWGLKRPLPIRRRDAKLAIHNVDTIYQQTEWTSAHTDTEFLRKFDELAVTPQVSVGRWAQKLPSSDKLWLHDSDLGGKERVLENQNYIASYAPTPNTLAMSPKRFERYLRKIRKQRQEFKPYIKERLAKEDSRADRTVKSLSINEPSPPAKELVYKAATSEARDPYILSFLAKSLAREAARETSTAIQPIPHPTGGLTYTNSSPYQNRYRSTPVPGRALHALQKRDNLPTFDVNVALAGWVGKDVSYKDDLEFSMTDFGTAEGDPRKSESDGEGMYRPTSVFLHSPPEVVGKSPERLEKTQLSMEVVNWIEADEHIQNPHKPGSREYVAHLNAWRNGGDYLAPQYRQAAMTTMVPSAARPLRPKKEGEQSKLLALLKTTVGKAPTDDDLAKS